MRLAFGDFNIDESPFGFTLKNPAHTNTFWISTKDRNLVLSDKYMEVGFEVHSQEIFGWGERTSSFMLHEGEYSSWPTGLQKQFDEGARGRNTYGDHPFVLARLNDRSYLGLFLKNTNAKVLKFIKEPKGKAVINFRTIGGILEVYAFMGETADEVLREYHTVIGKPHLPPFWALGFHQGSSGYTNDTVASNSVDKFKQANIPLEALWLDEQYMSQFRPFDVDKKNFANVASLTTKLKKDNQWLGISMHPCIPLYDESGSIYSYFSEFNQTNVFIKSQSTTAKFGDVLIGSHLPGK